MIARSEPKEIRAARRRDRAAEASEIPPLRPRLPSWQSKLRDRSLELRQLVEHFGSPLHLLHPRTFASNLDRLAAVFDDAGLEHRILFARKANKALSFVDVCREHGAGVDTASETELRQALERGVQPARLVCTAAVKSESLVRTCVAHGVQVVVDNVDELWRVASVARTLDSRATVAVRLGGFRHDGRKLPTRFGFDVDTVLRELDEQFARRRIATRIELAGLHFHLDGYDASQRVSAIDASLDLHDALLARGHRVRSLDIGGGLPVCYLKYEHDWTRFWHEHRAALRGERPLLTYRGHGLGLRVDEDGEVEGEPQTYPFWQDPPAPSWMRSILDSLRSGGEGTVADAVRRRELELRCEPGRSLLDGCGATIARVESRKPLSANDPHHPDAWLFALAMNTTHCRTSSADLLLDPLHVPVQQSGVDELDRTPPVDGFLTGAYCTEGELILQRRLVFEGGVAVGDLVVLPNTAGYFMHFKESPSHQFPLPRNVAVDDRMERVELDPIDRD